MINIVVLSYRTGDRVVKYIKEVFEASNVELNAIAIVDNSPEESDYFAIKSGLEEIGAICTNQTFDGEYKYRIKAIQSLYYQNTPIILVDTMDNLGYGKGNNLGFLLLKKHHPTKYVLLSNEDILFKDNYLDLRHLLDDLNNNPQIALLGPHVEDLQGNTQSPCRYLTFEERMVYPYLVYPLQKWLPIIKKEIIDIEKLTSVYRLIGAFMIADADRFEECGMFDDEIFLYAEELVLSEQLSKHGYDVACDPMVTVLHETSLSSVFDAKSALISQKRMFMSNLYYYRVYRGESKYKLWMARAAFNVFLLKYRIVQLIRRR